MAKVSFQKTASYKLRGNRGQWNVEFQSTDNKSLTNFNLIDGKIFPATDVSYTDIKPHIIEENIGPEIPIAIWAGYQEPTDIQITFAESDAIQIRKALNLLTKKPGGARKAMSIGTMEKSAVNIVVSEYTEKDNKKPIHSRVFACIPKDPATVQLGSEDTTTNQISFKIIGVV